MKNNKKKRGFTIIELVIVIAVIAILAGVLIPTFSSVIEKANKSARLQTAQQALVVALADQKDAALEDGTIIAIKDGSTNYYFKYEDGELTEDSATTAAPTDKNTLVNGTTDATTAATEGSKGSRTLKDLSKDVTIYISDTDFEQAGK